MSTQNNESKNTSNLATIPSGFATAGKQTQKEIEKQVVEQGVENWKASYAKPAPAPKMGKGRKIAIAIILTFVVICFALMLLIAGGAFGV